MVCFKLDCHSRFKDFFYSYSNSSTANATTINTREKRLMKYAFEFWDKPWKDISKAFLLDWRERLNKTKLATRTKNDTMDYVKQVSKHAYDVYDLPDVARTLKPFPLQLKDLKEVSIITYSDFQKMMKFEKDEEIKSFFVFLYFTGCRKGEARALKIEDYNPITHSIHIYKSMRRGADSLKTTKTKNNRYVILDELTEMVVKNQIRKNRNRKFMFGGDKPMDLNSLRMHFKKDLSLAGLPDNKIHSLRHSNVSILWAAGVPIPEISKRIGHSSPRITMDTYSHIFDVKQSDSVNALNNLFDSRGL